MKMMSYLVDCLDERGIFHHDFGELSASPAIRRRSWISALPSCGSWSLRGSLRPNLAECLTRQLEAKDLAEETLMRLTAGII